ncbi:MAG: ABC transporter permease subunit [Candidatus Borkfalkiaceae bacterium]|nr:ABC transporter permease subunit [Christensenellaceae bacterium]
MFSKALFKQSCKANGVMWSIITFAVCFMLACVMLISGSGNISSTKTAIQDTLIKNEIESSMEKRAINYYTIANDALNIFDKEFVKAFNKTEYERNVAFLILKGNSAEQAKTRAAANYYLTAIQAVQKEATEKAAELGYAEDSDRAKEILGVSIFSLNPELIKENDEEVYNKYASHSEDLLETYDVKSLAEKAMNNKGEDYIASIERRDYVSTRAEKASSNFLAINITSDKAVDEMVKALTSYGVTKEKYIGFNYTYDNVKSIVRSTVITYSNRYEYELGILQTKYANGEFASEEAYLAAVEKMNTDLTADIANSLLASLPQEVSDAIEDIGRADLYTLIVGSIFYKLAGLLLPIIYMIMAANNLISGQVDSGSMAYVLSTSTKRKTVVFTQALYLIGSLLVMFLLTTATGCVCLAIIDTEVDLTYGKLILLNVGAFLVLFALSGLNFFTSCYFDRSKRSMAIGGGLSIFALVAAMLGLFGSQVIPKVVRLNALNYFNYTTIISMFDVVSIMDGTVTFIWKFAILAALGIIGIIAGSVKFIKKDLPL